MTAITTLLFDAGGVILTELDRDAVIARRAALAARLGFPTLEQMWDRFYTGPEWQAAKTGGMQETEMWDALLRPYGLDAQAQEQFVADLNEGVGVDAEMIALLGELRSLYRMGILSNASDRLEAELDAWAVTAFFDVVVNTHRVGVAKPEPSAFHLALQLLGATPAETLFIDDKPRNTAAAEALGIRSFVFEHVAGLRAELARLGLLPSKA